MGSLLLLIYCGSRSVAKNLLSEVHSPSGLGGGFFGCHRLGHNGLLVIDSRPQAERKLSFHLACGDSAGLVSGRAGLQSREPPDLRG